MLFNVKVVKCGLVCLSVEIFSLENATWYLETLGFTTPLLTTHFGFFAPINHGKSGITT